MVCSVFAAFEFDALLAANHVEIIRYACAAHLAWPGFKAARYAM